MPTLPPAHGNWVSGERFWDREQDLRMFGNLIDEGANVLLVAQRRMGKTSLLREAQIRLKDRYLCIFVDLEKATGPAYAIAELSLATRPFKSLWNKSKEVFSNILSKVADTIDSIEISEIGVTLRDGLGAGAWAAKGDELFRILAESEKPVILMLDELPILVNRMLKGSDYTITDERRARADEFMHWLRRNTQNHHRKLRVVLSGSIGLEPVLHQAGLSAAITHLAPFELKPWDNETAFGCLGALANHCRLSYEEGTREMMLEKLGCLIPHHVQMFFDHARTRCIRRKDEVIRREDVQSVYDEDMLSSRGMAELTHYEERLKEILGPEASPLAVDMVSEAALEGVLSREALNLLREEYSFEERDPETVQKEIVWVLEHDGYLQKKPGGWVFVSKLLKDWWCRRYREFYIPIKQRRR